MFDNKWETETIIGGSTILLFAILKAFYKLRHILRHQNFYNRKTFRELINCDLASQFLDLKYNMKFNTESKKKKRALEIVCNELCDRYNQRISLMILKVSGNHKPIEDFCRYKYHSEMVYSVIELAKKRLFDQLHHDYYIKFYEVFDEFSQPFTDSLMEELAKVIDRFKDHKGHNYSRLLLQILEIHFTFTKIFLKYLNVNCKLLNGSLD